MSLYPGPFTVMSAYQVSFSYLRPKIAVFTDSEGFLDWLHRVVIVLHSRASASG